MKGGGSSGCGEEEGRGREPLLILVYIPSPCFHGFQEPSNREKPEKPSD